jgi:hypothetical protein
MGFELMSIDTLPLILPAYLDPGSGSLMLQLLIAGALSSLFMVKSTLVEIRGVFGRLFRKGA